jgi:tetratricopeptide (TPR) repeat protein
MKSQPSESLSCDTLLPEMVDPGVADMAEERDLRAAVAEARRTAEGLNGQGPARERPAPPPWPLKPGSLAEAVYWYRRLAGQELYTRPEDVLSALSNLGYSWRTDQRWTDAENAFQESLELRREYGDRTGEGHTWRDLGHLYQAQNRWADAEAAFRRSLAIAREIGDRWSEAAALGDQGISHAALGAHEEAVSCLEQAILLATQVGNRPGEARLRKQLARITQRP